MFQLREQHMQAIGRNIFVDRVTKFLIEEFPEAGDMDHSELGDEVARQVRKAESYGLHTERQAVKYVVTAWMMGTDFDTKFDATRGVLPSEQFTADEKAEWLEEWVMTIFEALENR